METRLHGVLSDRPHLADAPVSAVDAEISSVGDARDFSWVPRRVGRSLQVLLESHQYANDLGADDWEFAIQLTALRSEGLTDMDVRWMVQAGLIDFAYEVSLPGEAKRQFRRTPNLVFSESLCLILSSSGITGAEACFRSQPQPGHFDTVFQPDVSEDPPAFGRVPQWDRDRQELRVENVVVKRFKAPAANQETILAAFEEERWPPRIDDPLSPCAELEPKRRLHDTINSLNRNQKAQLLRFFGDGSGTGIRWEFIEASKRGERAV